MTPDLSARIADALFQACLRQVLALLEQGSVPRQVDLALQSAGWAVGPFRLLDSAGRAQEGAAYSAIPGILRAKGRAGVATNAGYYLYTADFPTGLRDPEIEAAIVAHTVTLGFYRREIRPAEIIAVCGRALAGAAEDIHAETGAPFAEIDAIAVAELGWPSGYRAVGATVGETID